MTADASLSTSPDGTALSSYQFYYGDGTAADLSTSPTDTHTYTAPGTYQVTVTVTDALGRTGTATAPVTVVAPDVAPTAALTVDPDLWCRAAVGHRGRLRLHRHRRWPIATYTFDFGDGTIVGPRTGATATHTYQRAGTFTVTVTVTDTSGLSSTATAMVTVTRHQPRRQPRLRDQHHRVEHQRTHGDRPCSRRRWPLGLQFAAVLSNTTTSTSPDCTLERRARTGSPRRAAAPTPPRCGCARTPLARPCGCGSVSTPDRPSKARRSPQSC